MSEQDWTKQVVHIGAQTRCVDPIVADEIERLRAVIAGDHDLSIAEWHSDRAELLKRIEELEKQAKLWKDLAWITDEQIDLAWHLKSGPALATLACFGIVRCDHLKASQINGELVEPCPDCNGHGWIKTSALVDKCGQFGTDDD